MTPHEMLRFAVMLVRIAISLFLSVQPVVGLRDDEAIARRLLAADIDVEESQTTRTQKPQELEVSMAEVQELNELSSAEANEVKAKSMCDKELQKLQNALKKSCEKYQPRKAKAQCQAYATKTVNDAAVYPWHESLVSDHIGAKVPVFWAGFSDFDTSGMASKKDLTDFVIDVNGLLLHGGLLAPQTEWGKVVQDANDLASCPWDRKKGFWQVASTAMAKAMYHAKKNKIMVAVRKELTGDYSLFNSILYQIELMSLGNEIFHHPDWTPTFEVHEIPVAKSSDCTVAPWLKRQLEHYASRSVAVTCSLCPKGLRACGSQKQVNKAEMTYSCTAGDCSNGKGEMISVDGDRYEGDFKNDKMDGKGKLFYASGDRYEGDYKNGEKDGKGKLFYADGSHYEGDYKNGKMNGKGKYSFATGDRYEGDFKNDKMDGKGKYFHADGDRYEGGYKNDEEDGKGMWFFKSGKRVECLYKMGKQIKCK